MLIITASKEGGELPHSCTHLYMIKKHRYPNNPTKKTICGINSRKKSVSEQFMIAFIPI